MPPADTATQPPMQPYPAARMVGEGLERHGAQNALARAICLIEDVMDRAPHDVAMQATLEAALHEIECAGRLIAKL